LPPTGWAPCCDAINASSYGLTLGCTAALTPRRISWRDRVRVGNFYVNRNQIGAVVEAQPFGGEGLSGTGPKAGRPHYLPRFALERTSHAKQRRGGRQCRAVDLGRGLRLFT